MPRKEITLETALFLDSEPGRALSDLKGEDVRRIAEAFVGACYDGVGKKPELLDDADLHAVLGHVLPGSFRRKDPLAEHVPAVLRAYLEHLETAHVVPHAFELRRALDGNLEEFLTTVRTGENPHHGPPQEPVVHKAAKLGRNDPCFCGSGKKFKKCHGKG